MVLQSKKEVFEKLTKEIGSSPHLVFTEYQGLTVLETEELRKHLRSLNSKYQIPKNKILSLVFKSNKLEQLAQGLAGPMGLVFIKNDDPVQALKKLLQFSKDHNKFKLKSGYMFGKLLSLPEMTRVANLPSKEILIGQSIIMMKMPFIRLMNAMKSSQGNLVCVLQQIKNKKEKAQ
ncbi:MAG: 50S ribosomal protein L10 [Elusimicrobia bacterium RIFOXYB2_FULL_48_7]|nr:MAG: 50S ribosomal protein L10 [Elusimicrobia bacterium RIFOXYB2_FULL_48_7]